MGDVQNSLPSDEADPIDLEVAPQDTGTRFDKWLSDHVDSLTRSRAKALIGAGCATRDGAVVHDPATRVHAGERYRIVLPAIAPAEPKGEPLALDVQYEDDHLIVLNKPAGLVVHPAAGNWTGTLVNALIAHCGASLSGIGGVARPGIVHRLDKDTSGLLVVAKNDAAHQALSQAFAAHDIVRAYLAIAVGCPRPAIGTIDAPLARGGGDRKSMVVVRENDDRPDQRRAVTHYRVLEVYGRSRAKLAGDGLASLIECRLETGRTHQIRVHLGHIGCPLIGDPAYGRGPGLAGLRPVDAAADRALEVLSRFRRQALHAGLLGFAHPATGETLKFEAPPPADFTELMAALSVL